MEARLRPLTQWPPPVNLPHPGSFLDGACPLTQTVQAMPPPALHLHSRVGFFCLFCFEIYGLNTAGMKFYIYLLSPLSCLSPGQLALNFPYRALSSAEAPSLLAGQ